MLTVLQTKNDGIKIIIHYDETEPDKIVVCARWKKPTGNPSKPEQIYVKMLNFERLEHKDTHKFLTTLDKSVWNPPQSQNIFSQLWDGMKRYFRVQSLLKSMRNSKP